MISLNALIAFKGIKMNLENIQSYNEWDPLEEVIVGRAEGAIIPSWDEIDRACYGEDMTSLAFKNQGQPFPSELLEKAKIEVEGFVDILIGEGVKVHRPEITSHQDLAFSTPDWKWNGGGFNQANPRDLIMVVGDTIIEAPTCRKNRQHELKAYRSLLQDLAPRSKWLSAPRPLLSKSSFNNTTPSKTSSLVVKNSKEIIYPITNHEALFEAADFMRCGRDIFYQRSYVSNQKGVDWIKNILGSEYRFHEIVSKCRRPIHIDTTFIPLAPGKALINPEFVESLPSILDNWEIKLAPPPIVNPSRSPYQFGSDWLSMNLFSLDKKRVFVERRQVPLIHLLSEWGFEPVPIPFENFYILGGGLHCCTLDLRRRGSLESYF
jgi:glycine amidinotransferase